MRQCKERSLVKIDLEKITGVFSDGRKDLTRVLEYDEKTGRYHQRFVREEHSQQSLISQQSKQLWLCMIGC